MPVPWRTFFLSGALAFALLVGAGDRAVAAELTAAERTELERLLAQLNFDPGTVDGEIDANTRAAIRGYQDFAALEPNGEATPALLRELRQVASAFAEIAADAPEKAADTPSKAAIADAVTPEAAPVPDSSPELEQTGSPGAQPAQPAPAESQAAQSQAAQSQAAQSQAAEPEPAGRQPAEVQPSEPEPKIAETGETPSDVTVPEEPTPEVTQGPDVASERAPAAEPEAAPVSEAAQPGEAELPEAVAPAPSDRTEPESGTGQATADAAAPEAAQSPAPPAPAAKAASPEPAAAAFDLGGVIARLKTATTMESPSDLGATPPAPPVGIQNSAIQAAALPGTVDGYRTFRQAYQTASAGDYDRAIDLYTQSIESGDLSVEDLAAAFYNRANAYHYRGALDYAIADYGRAIVNNPELPAAYYNRGYAYREIGDEAHAVADFKAARARGWERLGMRASDLPPPRP